MQSQKTLVSLLDSLSTSVIVRGAGCDRETQTEEEPSGSNQGNQVEFIYIYIKYTGFSSVVCR